jgi:N-acetyl-anhydromuramyl-L-alanine amidase AmpD
VAGAHTRGENHCSIGVCFVGDFDRTLPPDRQWRQGLRLCAWLCREYRLRPKDVFGHRNFANKTCPGSMFDLNKFRRDLAAELGAPAPTEEVA